MNTVWWSASFKARTAIGFGAVVIATLYTHRYISKMRKNRKKITRIIDTIPEFSNPSVHIKDPKKVEELVCELIRGGASKLQVISDFDMTLSRFHKNGNRCHTCHGAVSTSPIMPKFYQDRSQAFFKHYYPLEVDASIPMDKKVPLMNEWWTKAHDLLIDCGIEKSNIKDIVKSSKTFLRDGCDFLFSTLYKHDIPLLLFSAGLGDILVEVIKQRSHFYDNMKVISNFIEFDENGKSIQFKGNTIHIFNKNISSCENSSYFGTLSNRQNVIVMGDSEGDINMQEGVPNPTAVLKIGFLNDKIDERLSDFMEMYDIVLVDDQSMDVVNGLLSKIL